MKRIAMLLLALLLLTGCANDPDPTQPPTEPTEPPRPWTETAGMPWDTAGVLLEMPLTIPDGTHYTVSKPFDADLLMWSLDEHLPDQHTLELCVVELDDGTVTAQRDVTFGEYAYPQVLGDAIYLHDTTDNRILKLNKELKTVKEWHIQPLEGDICMAADEKFYHLDSDMRLTLHDLNTGTSVPALEEDPDVSWITAEDGYMTVEYYRNDTGAKAIGSLDLSSGVLSVPNMDGFYDTAVTMNGDWLCGQYMDDYLYDLSIDGGPAMRLSGTNISYSLLPEGYLLATGFESGTIALYDMQGKLVSAACAYASGDCSCGNLIWNETLGGYFVKVSRYEEPGRLLFWDISKTIEADDLEMIEIPAPEEAEASLRARAVQIGEKYGLTVLVGSQCETQFDEFTATQVTDWDRVNSALDDLEEALAAYPDGFIRQLRYGGVHGIQIHLVCDLFADGSGRYGDGYAAFTQEQWEHYLMVMDIDDTSVQTYYHEFSHIIDSYLEWDAGQRPEALFSEDAWGRLNPGWFSGYTYDYSQEHELYDYDSFVDGYSTIKPTEDRARVMEYAMAGCYWTFEDSPGLYDKLYYYSQCIRDAFDTTGWPDPAPWEEPLN